MESAGSRTLSPIPELLHHDLNLNLYLMQILDNMVVLDANHPLAGRSMTFEIELLGIEKQTA